MRQLVETRHKSTDQEEEEEAAKHPGASAVNN